MEEIKNLLDVLPESCINYGQISRAAHMIKTEAGLANCKHIHYAAYFIQKAYHDENIEMVI